MLQADSSKTTWNEGSASGGEMDIHLLGLDHFETTANLVASFSLFFFLSGKKERKAVVTRGKVSVDSFLPSFLPENRAREKKDCLRNVLIPGETQPRTGAPAMQRYLGGTVYT